MNLGRKPSQQTEIELQEASFRSPGSSGSPRSPLRSPLKSALKKPLIKADHLYFSTNPQIKDNITPTQPGPTRPSFMSRLHFSFAVKLIRFINSLKAREINEGDLDNLVHTEKSEDLEGLFTKHYYELREKYSKQMKLLSLVLYAIFKKKFFIQIIWQLLFVCSRLLIPYFLYLCMLSVRDRSLPISHAYSPAACMFVCFILGHYSAHQVSFNAACTANEMKVGLLGMMFRKVNNVTLLSLQRLSLGKVTNLVAADVNTLDNIYFISFLGIAPLTFVGGTVILWQLWGPSGLIGIGYMLIILFLEKVLLDQIIPAGAKKNFYGDERIRVLFEALEAIRVVKMQSLEFNIMDVIIKIRANEIKEAKKLNFMISIVRALAISSQPIAVFLLLFTHNTATDNDILAIKIFPIILLFSYLKLIGMIYTQLGFLHILLMKSLSIRVMSVMDLPEVGPPRQINLPLSPENSVEFINFSGYWTKKDLGKPTFLQQTPSPLPPEENTVSPIPAISKINLNIKKGDLVALVGPVGAGKSSLLLSFTREMNKTCGELRFAGKFDYVAQEPMVISMSIRDSVTFGRVYNERRFWKVMEVCCLTEVIANLPKKEMTDIAEKGVNFTGAQRIQIALARSLYTKADIYLIDDPFSNFDPRLSKLIFRKAIQEFLRDATVILVTNNLNFVKHANQIVVLEAGQIIAQGTYSELAKKEAGVNIIEEIKARIKHEKRDVESYGSGRHFSEVYKPLGKKESEAKKKNRKQTAIDLFDEDRGLFIRNERLDDGKVTFSIYWHYIRSIFNWWNFIPAIILFVGAESVGLQFMTHVSYWLQGQYSDSEAYLILGLITFGALIAHMIKLIGYNNSGLEGTRHLHDKMLKGVLQSPLRFFDRNHIGRILNRFANDLGILDRSLLTSFLDVIEGFCFFMIYLTALWVKEPWILVPAGSAFTFFILIYLLCRKSINQTRGLELTMRGPVCGFFLVLVNGLTILRARNQTENIMKAFYQRADNYSKAHLSYRTSVRFMSFLMDYVTEITVMITFGFYIHAKESPITNGPFVKMLIALPSTMQWLLRNFTIFHSLMASPARVINYCQNHEGIGMIQPNDERLAKEGWPQKGEIDIQHADLKYGEHEALAIKDLSIHLRPGEKIGVVGYSGFGMTTLIQMLAKAFRIEPKPDSHIKIDDVDINDVGVHLLRKSMIIVSQDYYLFTATIRENVDPWKKYSDQEIWDALETVGLKPFIEKLDKRLETYYTRGSSLFSVGQKQLLSFARAIMKKSNIFIQDRATNHVDFFTDQIVQKKIRDKFNHATHLTTTFRLWNVSDCDKILSIKNGVKVEFDEPYKLLVKEIGDVDITNNEGYFASLVLDMNPKVAKQTFEIAMTQYYETHNIVFDESLIRNNSSPTFGNDDSFSSVRLSLRKDTAPVISHPFMYID